MTVVQIIGFLGALLVIGILIAFVIVYIYHWILTKRLKSKYKKEKEVKQNGEKPIQESLTGRGGGNVPGSDQERVVKPEGVQLPPSSTAIIDKPKPIKPKRKPKTSWPSFD